jgi:hypothetical protein
MSTRTKQSEIVSVRELQILGHMRVRLLFSDGLVRELDLSPMLTGPAFARHRTDETFFSRAHVLDGTVTWPDDSDLDPIVLHGDELPANGDGPRVLGESDPSSVQAS